MNGWDSLLPTICETNLVGNSLMWNTYAVRFVTQPKLIAIVATSESPANDEQKEKPSAKYNTIHRINKYTMKIARISINLQMIQLS